MNQFDVVIVGAGHGGAQAAALLRQMKFDGSVALVGDEPELPYERPPLSKEYLLGSKEFQQILIRPAAFWKKEGVELIPGRRVVTVQPADRAVTLDDGSSIGYGKLVWATGGAPRSLTCPGASANTVHAIRTRQDIDEILRRIARVSTVMIVGGGYIGLEVAAALTKLGKSVTVLEALDRVLSRVAGQEISRFFEAKHRNEGVDIRTGVNVKCIEGGEGGPATVILEGGERLDADLLIAGIGIVPATQALIDAGAGGTNGVDVDEHCRTTLEDVYAIGDCAAHCNRFADHKRIRLESVQNAYDQAKTAISHILGNELPYTAVPWFWSNQFDIKLQTIGISQGQDRTEVSGDPGTNSFSVEYYREDRIVAVDCVNSPKAFVQGRSRIAAEFVDA